MFLQLYSVMIIQRVLTRWIYLIAVGICARTGSNERQATTRVHASCHNARSINNEQHYASFLLEYVQSCSLPILYVHSAHYNVHLEDNTFRITYRLLFTEQPV